MFEERSVKERKKSSLEELLSEGGKDDMSVTPVIGVDCEMVEVVAGSFFCAARMPRRKRGKGVQYGWQTLSWQGWSTISTMSRDFLRYSMAAHCIPIMT